MDKVFITAAVAGSGPTRKNSPYIPYSPEEIAGEIVRSFEADAAIAHVHVRVGFEDNVYLSRGLLAKSNADLVEKAVRLARELGREIATPGEVRKMLNIKKGL